MPAPTNKFEETIDFLLEELILAIKWGRPSILLAVHKSKPSQYKAEATLKNKLKKIGVNVLEIKVDGESPNALNLILTSKADVEKDVFFISNIDQGGGEDGRNAYRALNLYRETFIENNVKAVFWLTTSEEKKLPNYAPDFWAFRHRVVEFSSTHQSGKASPPVGLLLWDMQNLNGSSDSLNEKISARKHLLEELPDRPEALSSRIEILHTLGYIYWILGDISQADNFLTSALDLAARDEFQAIKEKSLNGLAILAYEKGEYQKAFDIYSNLVEKNTGSGLFKSNFAVVLSALGKNYLALIQAEKAAKLDMTNEKILISSGYLYILLGKLDEAVKCFKNAIQLAPTRAESYELLAICYNKMSLIEDARDQINRAVMLAGDRLKYSLICKEALFGEPGKALLLLKMSIANSDISKQEILRDPALNTLFAQSEIQAVVE
jgi:tetratricopeptide (TPR) repeat protein